MNSSYISDDDLYRPMPLVACSTLRSIGIYIVVLFIISFISNITLIYALIKYRKNLLTALNIQILCLSILNLFGTMIELPMVGIAAFVCRFIFGSKIGCIIEGYTMYVLYFLFNLILFLS